MTTLEYYFIGIIISVVCFWPLFDSVFANEFEFKLFCNQHTLAYRKLAILPTNTKQKIALHYFCSYPPSPLPPWFTFTSIHLLAPFCYALVSAIIEISFSENSICCTFILSLSFFLLLRQFSSIPRTQYTQPQAATIAATTFVTLYLCCFHSTAGCSLFLLIANDCHFIFAFICLMHTHTYYTLLSI